MRLVVATIVVGLSPAIASASPPADERFAIAVNEPFFWSQKVIGVSLYLGLGNHQAIRANVANYPAVGTQVTAAIAAPSGGTPDDRGGYFDVGAGWQWYPRELWRGPTVELGLVWRSDKARDPDAADMTPVFEVERDATAIVARGLVGWSWLFYDRVFIMAAAGGAVGYERGTERVQLDDYTTMYTRPAPSVVATLEGYLRFGWTF
jgi:hypothetical protein